MFKRPKVGEDENDILRLQEEFKREKDLNSESNERQNIKITHRSLSKFAQSKGIKKEIDKEVNHKNYSDLLNSTSLVGEIVEKNYDSQDVSEMKPMPSQGFPLPIKQTQFTISRNHLSKATSNVDKQYSPKSCLLSSQDADSIHNENVSLLKKISEKEILEEQQKLLTTLDLKTINFLKSKRDQHNRLVKTDIGPTNISNSKIEKSLNLQKNTSNINSIDLWEIDVLSNPDFDKWLHFDTLESDKLEWMKGVQENIKNEPDVPYEARFDFNGYLLPYKLEYTELTKPLFHHADDNHRPGYSLTELFELSRSSVLQQRSIALNTLAGILEYYTSGTYKDVIELPLSKVFFVIRIALDENKIIILEPALKAMRNIICNRLDEASLDALIGFSSGTEQPCLENSKPDLFELELKENELEDYHLAEIDLIAAALRTDILQRLYYILEKVKPNLNCVHYALQILTRIARDSVNTAKMITDLTYLTQSIINHFIPCTSINFFFDAQMVYNNKPILAALKFLRVLSLQSREVSELLVSKFHILKPITEYIVSGVDGTYGLKLQIEAFCIFTNLLQFGVGKDSALNLFPAILTLLYKHVQGTDIYIESSILSATHAAVILQCMNAIVKVNQTGFCSVKEQIYPLLRDGTSKWLTELAQCKGYTCGHLRPLCATLDCLYTVLLIENVPMPFLNSLLVKLSSSTAFQNIIENLNVCSNLTSDINSNSLYLIKNLMSLGTSVIDSSYKTLPILNVVSPVPFLISLFKVLEQMDNTETNMLYFKSATNYLKKIATQEPRLTDNWFTRVEIELVLSIINLSQGLNLSESHKDLVYFVANKLLHILKKDKKFDLYNIFNNIVFNKKWLTVERLLSLVSISDKDRIPPALSSIDVIKMCYSININWSQADCGPNVASICWKEPVLPRDWIYLPILNLYSKNQEIEMNVITSKDHGKSVPKADNLDKTLVISCTLEWILFNELCFSDHLSDINITDRFCRLMCVFLCDNSLFLDQKIKMLLQNCTLELFKKEKNNQFDFSKQLSGLSNFQDLYTQFLEHFQSVSYGDETFAACVLVPLAQKHDVKWRKMLWSEYAGCLRALDCKEAVMCYNLDSYLYPVETDESLIQSYYKALSNNLLRPNTIAYFIAEHHVKAFMSRTSHRK